MTKYIYITHVTSRTEWMQQGSGALRCWCACFPPTEGVVGLEKSCNITVAEPRAGQHAAECMFSPLN